MDTEQEQRRKERMTSIMGLIVIIIIIAAIAIMATLELENKKMDKCCQKYGFTRESNNKCIQVDENETIIREIEIPTTIKEECQGRR